MWFYIEGDIYETAEAILEFDFTSGQIIDLVTLKVEQSIKMGGIIVTRVTPPIAVITDFPPCQNFAKK